MGKTLKAVLALSICGLVLLYVMGTAIIDEVYVKKVSSLEKEIAIFSSRNELQAEHNLELEAGLLSVQTQLDVEREKVRLMGAAISSGGAAATSAPSRTGGLSLSAATTAPTSTQGSAVLIAQKMRLNAVTAQAQTTTTQPKVTSAS